MKEFVVDFDNECKINGYNNYLYYAPDGISKKFDHYLVFINPLGSSVLFSSDSDGLVLKWIKYVTKKHIDDGSTVFEFVCEEIGADFKSKTVTHNIIASKKSQTVH